MAHVRIRSENRTISEAGEIARFLAPYGIDYERWEPAHPIGPDASSEEILAAYAGEIERLKAAGGYVSADVINVNRATPGLDEMLQKFSREHWHADDEVIRAWPPESKSS
ncbi:MAG: hypothetical protein ABI882_24120, partial [Acidobacteriota bacterium]